MAWTDLTFPGGSKLTSTKMTQVASNFAALAAGEAGAPPLAVNSFMASGVSSLGLANVSSGFSASGVSSLGQVNVSNGLAVSGVSSLGLVNANGGYLTSGVSSLGLVNAAGGYLTTQVGSFGGLDVSSAMSIHGAAASPPAANTLYKENIPKGWINFNGTGVIAIRSSFNVASITDNGVGDFTVTWDRDFADANYAASTALEKDPANLGSPNYTTGGKAAGSLRVICARIDTTAVYDPSVVDIIAIGDQ